MGATGTKHVPVTAVVGISPDERKNDAKEARQCGFESVALGTPGVLLPAAASTAENDRTTQVSSTTFNMNPESV